MNLLDKITQRLCANRSHYSFYRITILLYRAGVRTEELTSKLSSHVPTWRVVENRSYKPFSSQTLLWPTIGSTHPF